jgi:hypothetical protein
MFDHRRLRTGVPQAWALLLAAVVIAATAGCASHSPGTSQNSVFGITLKPGASPSWARDLGQGVVVVAPAVTAPGHGSPGAVVTGFSAAVSSHRLVGACPYFPPGSQAQCQAAFESPSPPAVTGVQKDFSLGYVMIDGNKALVGATETTCSAGQTSDCSSNTQLLAALLTRGETFAALWNETMSQISGSKTNYPLYPCILVNGRWYLYSS